MVLMKISRILFFLLLSGLATAQASQPKISSGQSAQPAVQAEQTLGRATAVQKRANGVDIRAGAAAMRITALDDDTIRVQISPNGSFPVDNSWAVLKESVAAMKPSALAVITDSAAVVELATKDVHVRVMKNGLNVAVLDASGNVISQVDPARLVSFRRVPVYIDAINV